MDSRGTTEAQKVEYRLQLTEEALFGRKKKTSATLVTGTRKFIAN